MRDRLFTIIEGEPVITAPLVNIGPFKSLWDSDITDDKSDYNKWVLYIYYVCDYRSEMYEVKNKSNVAMMEVFGEIKDIPSIVQDCMKVYIDYNCVPEQRALDAAISSSDNMGDTLNALQQESKALSPLLDAMEAEIARLLRESELELAADMMSKKFSLQEKQLALAGKAADMVPKIEKNVVAMITIREKVENAIAKAGAELDRLEQFIIDDLIISKENDNYIVG